MKNKINIFSQKIIQIIIDKFGVENKGWFIGGSLRSYGRRLWKKIGGGKENFLKCLI